MSFIESNIETKSKIKTDGWSGYLPFNSKSYDYLREIISMSDEDVSTLSPGVHLVASLFKRLILGIYQGRFDKKHIQKYLDEFTFRYNRRTSRSVGQNLSECWSRTFAKCQNLIGKLLEEKHLMFHFGKFLREKSG